MYKGILFTSDMHLRDTVPKCRTDDFLAAQWGKLRCVAEYARKEKLAWIDGGDLFHTARPSLSLLREFIGRMNTWGASIDGMVLGNHDLPSHNKGRMNESGVGVCFAANVVKHILNCDGLAFQFKDGQDAIVYGASYGETYVDWVPTKEGNSFHTNILVLHEMVYANRKSEIPGVAGVLAKRILENMEDYEVIVTGHNHQSFWHSVPNKTLSDSGRKLFNIGCLTRQSAIFSEHTPRVMIWRPFPRGCEWETLTCTYGVVSREHIDKQEAKEEQINDFVKSLQNVDEVSLSFEHNVERILEETKPEKPVVDKVREAIR